MTESLVKIIGSEKNGTGFFVSPEYIVTCCHVLENSSGIDETVSVKFNDREDRCQAKVITVNKDDDFALLESSVPVEKYYALSRNKIEKTNATLCCYPHGAENYIPVSVEIVGFDGKGNIALDNSNSAQVGHSGGPVIALDNDTAVVGVFNALYESDIYGHGGNKGGAIPASKILDAWGEQYLNKSISYRKIKQLSETKLWKRFEKKADSDKAFIDAVADVCLFGISKNAERNPLVRLVRKDFMSHVCELADNLEKLIDYSKTDFSGEQLACLLMSACCLETGINLTEEEKEKYCGNYEIPEWREFFSKHTKEHDKYASSHTVSDETQRLFLVSKQETTMKKILKGLRWPDILKDKWISKDNLIYLCENKSWEKAPSENLKQGILDADALKFCAIYLHIADILCLNANRMPELKIHEMRRLSDDYWGDKLESCNWRIADGGAIEFNAVCHTMQVEHELRTFIRWANAELRSCCHALRPKTDDSFPNHIHEVIEPRGYKSGRFCISMEQDRIIELLVGDNLYEDNFVFIRELLQNAIDAVHARAAFDNSFSEEDGQISMYSWQDEEGYTWFRIEDNGIGMTEDVIKNYFLKVGSSYYSSEHFAAEKAKYKSKSDYTPISRFGIGILSCFMGDRDSTILEVSTRHFSANPFVDEPAIRLDVTGLHGYYYLAAESEDEDESDFRPMHSMNGEAQRQDIGTSISVRIGQGFRESMRSVREIVEQYIQFPSVKVSFQDENGIHNFTTKQELMEKVHALNPDGPGKPLKKYVFPLTEEMKDKIYRLNPDFKWIEEPGIAFSFRPLDWYSATDEISGVEILCEALGKIEPFNDGKFDFSPEARIKEYYGYHAKKVFEISSGVSSDKLKKNEKESEQIRQQLENLKQKVFSDDLAEQYKKLYNQRDEIGFQFRVNREYEYEFYRQKNLSIDIPSNYFRESISAVIDVSEFLKINEERDFLTSFDGVIADTKPLCDINDDSFSFFVLLSGSMRPVVDVSRSGIQKLPLEAICNFKLIEATERETDTRHYANHASFDTPDIKYASEKELISVIEKYPSLEQQLESEFHASDGYEKISEIIERVGFRWSAAIWFALKFALAKKKGELVIDKSENGWYIYYGQQDKSTGDFPAQMFCTFKDSNAFYSLNKDIFNKHHPLSQWLIKNQKALKEKVPRLYDNLVHTMMDFVYAKEEIDAVNKILKQISDITSNAFDFTDDLYLSEDDFDESERLWQEFIKDNDF